MEYFTLFMLIWIFYFAFAYQVLGSEISRGDDFSLLHEHHSKSSLDPNAATTEQEKIRATTDKLHYDLVKDNLGSVGDDYSDVATFLSYLILAG